jgi:protein SCO1/2
VARTSLALAILAALALPAADGRAHDAHPGAAGDADYAFLPAPGSYELPPIRTAGGGTLLDETGRSRELTEVLRGRISVIAFIYTRCGDLCPAASLDMSRLQDVAAREMPSTHLQLVTVSFDPENDTPDVMRDYASSLRSADPATPTWLFLTAADKESLAPVLAAYDQRVDRKPTPAGSPNSLSHLFRGFLVDPGGRIRNIYSLDFFDPRLVLVDVRSLAIEATGQPHGAQRP